MAGNERSGPEAARADLFRNAPYFLCRVKSTPDGAVETMSDIAKAVGAIPLEISPEEHGYSVREVIETVRRVTSREFKVRESPRRPGDPPELVAAVDRAREVLGWTATHSDLSNIVQTAWNWVNGRKDRG